MDSEEVEMATTTVEKEMLELEKKSWQAIQENDVEAAQRATADPCIVAGASGDCGSTNLRGRESLHGLAGSRYRESCGG